MSVFTLELIVHNDSSYGSASELSLPIKSHVHKRIEKFIYTDQIRTINVPLTYIENPDFDSKVNLQIANRTYNVPANSPKLARDRSRYARVLGRAYSSPYEKVAVTNKTTVDENGEIKPLFYKHVLPANVTQAELQVRTRGNKVIEDTGYILDLDASTIFTNYTNFFDPDTGAYKLYYVISTDEDGNVEHEMLNPVSVAGEATWEDIDLDTGALTTDYPVYSIEQSTAGWNLYFNETDEWFIRPLARSLIQPLEPAGRDPDEPWFARFSVGNFATLVNSARRRYSVPEFDSQPFIPSKPTVYSPYTKLLVVNKNVLKATREFLNIEPSAGLHMNIFIENVDGEVIHALTTDTSKEGDRYADNVYWESDKIQSWDNAGGFISLNVDLLRSWSFYATYYYEAQDFEYNLVSLNPLNNKQAHDHTFVFYLIPDVNVNDRAIHHLVIDHGGTIVYTSQGPGGVAYPNLQLTDDSGAYNSDTVIGLKYISDIETDTFLTRYGAGFENTYGYMILSEVAVLDTGVEEDQYEIDVRRRGGVPLDEELKNVFRANPRILQSVVGYGPDGQEIPKNGVMIIDAPLSITEDYGGYLAQEDAERSLRTYMPAAGYAVINWTYPKTELSGTSLTASQVDLSWTWEGPSQTYKLYRRDTVKGEKTLIYTATSPSEGTISYTDTDVLSDEVYHYSVSITENGVEFPEGNLLSVKVR